MPVSHYAPVENCKILSVWGTSCRFSHNPPDTNDKRVFEEMHSITQWDYQLNPARRWEKTVSQPSSLSVSLPLSNADGYPALRLHSAMHTCHPVSLLRGQLCSCLLERFHRSCTFTHSEPAAGSFAVDSTEVIYFIHWLWHIFYSIGIFEKCPVKVRHLCWAAPK